MPSLQKIFLVRLRLIVEQQCQAEAIRPTAVQKCIVVLSYASMLFAKTFWWRQLHSWILFACCKWFILVKQHSHCWTQSGELIIHSLVYTIVSNPQRLAKSLTIIFLFFATSTHLRFFSGDERLLFDSRLLCILHFTVKFVSMKPRKSNFWIFTHMASVLGRNVFVSCEHFAISIDDLMND